MFAFRFLWQLTRDLNVLVKAELGDGHTAEVTKCSRTIVTMKDINFQ